MALTTYDELKSTIADYLDRDDLTSQIDDFIDLVEARHKREVRIRAMLSREEFTLDNRYENFPTRFLAAKYLRIQIPATETSNRRFYPDVTELSTHELTLKSRKDADTGAPKHFAIHEQLEFDRVPDQDYTAEIFFYKPLTALSDSNDSNEILSLAPDAYLYGALAASAPFLLNDERIPIWENAYITVVKELNKMTRQRTGPLQSVVAGAMP